MSLFGTRVEIGRRVKIGDLERALCSAAERLDLNIDSEIKRSKKYQLGSVREVEEYSHTKFRLIGRNLFSLQQMEIKVFSENPEDFYIYTGFPYGIANDDKIRGYLSWVSNYLSRQEQGFIPGMVR